MKLLPERIQNSNKEDGDKVTIGSSATVFTEDTTIYARWEPKTYNVTYDGNGSTDGIVPTDSSDYTAETQVTVASKDVTITGSYKDLPVTPPTTYTLIVKGSYAPINGAGEYEKGEMVTVYAGNRNNYSFNSWTSTDQINLANVNSATTSFIMPEEPVTVTANWTYIGESSSSESSSVGSTRPSRPTIPAADGSVKVEYSSSKGTTTLLINSRKTNEIIGKAKDNKAVLDLQSVRNTTAVKIAKSALSSFEKADLDVVVELPEGRAIIDNKALVSILDQSTGSADMKLELKQISTNNLLAV